jgi:hypothetical protein
MLMLKSKASILSCTFALFKITGNLGWLKIGLIPKPNCKWPTLLEHLKNNLKNFIIMIFFDCNFLFL